jgi:demethylmenaquinone methyltransferase / 2-methoxy-6-polyprenyl-1,4-benzoquinol methylase
MTRPEPSRPPDSRGIRAFPAGGDHAVREMAGMFDGVSDRYDLLNSLMSLGQDRGWRAALARTVPEDARVVLDLCTGNGVSLDGLLRPGRTVLGADVSLEMLRLAADDHGPWGWAPRLVASDAFRLPLRDHSLDAVTIGFGMRNLRPRAAALAELARVLRPGATLGVLEATAPRRGPLAPLHAFYARRIVPLLGRFSSSPSAYRYLGESIFDFGSGEEFERDLAAAGFRIVRREAYLFGAARLWTAQSLAGERLQNARSDGSDRVKFTTGPSGWEGEWRWWTTAQAVISLALTSSLVWALLAWINWRSRLTLDPWQRAGLWLLILAGVAGFAFRSVVLLLRLLGPPPRRGS